jgi:hypothetical protein
MDESKKEPETNLPWWIKKIKEEIKFQKEKEKQSQL